MFSCQLPEQIIETNSNLNSSQSDTSNIQLKMLPVETLIQKLELHMNLTEDNSEAVNILIQKSNQFGGVERDGFSRNNNYTLIRHTTWIRDIIPLACTEALNLPNGDSKLFPNNNLNAQTLFENMSNQDYTIEVDLIFQNIMSLQDFAALTLKEQQIIMCSVAAGNILAQAAL